MEDFLKKMQAEQNWWKKPAEELASSLMKILEDQQRNLDAPKILAHLIQQFDLETGTNHIGEIYLEWTVKEYISTKGPGLYKFACSTYDNLVKFGKRCNVLEEKDGRVIFEVDTHDWNDLDNYGFYIPHDTLKIYCITTQNYSWIIILDERGMRVYRYWDQIYDAEGDRLADLKKDMKRCKTDEELINFMLDNVEWHQQYYSDRVPGNKYVNRPDLFWFKQQNFDPDTIEKQCFVNVIFSASGGDDPLNNILYRSMHSANHIAYYNELNSLSFDISHAYEALLELEEEHKGDQ